MATELITIKVSPDTRTMLRVLAAHSGNEMHEVAESVLWAEMKRRKIDVSATLKGFEQRLARKSTNGKPKEQK